MKDILNMVIRAQKGYAAFGEIESDAIVANVLEGMLSVWLSLNQSNEEAPKNCLYVDAKRIIERLHDKSYSEESSEFLNIVFTNNLINKLPVDSSLIPIIDARLKEIQICLANMAHFAAIILAGSVLEGLLLSCAMNRPKDFNCAKASPKNGQTILGFSDWTLANFIDVAYEINLIKLDVKKFSHSLRDFRNYIHPHVQMRSKFKFDHHTSNICLQVLKAAIADLSGERKW